MAFKKSFSTIVTTAVLIFFVYIAISLFPPFYRAWRFSHLEENAKKVISPEQLQIWATNLLMAHPKALDEYMEVGAKDLGTNFPPQLLAIWRYKPEVEICVSNDTNSPGYVRILWSGGVFHMAAELDIGPTNFVWSGHMWAPGVYFVPRNG